MNLFPDPSGVFYGESGYLKLLEFVRKNGETRDNRTGTKVISHFSPPNLECDITHEFPLLTTKKVFFRGVIEELLFFLSGETQTKVLEEKGINIWKGNTTREFLDSRGLSHLPEGDMGKGYGYQWRNFGSDQIKNLLTSLKKDKYSRRHIVSAWNPPQLSEMALPPCHIMFQMNVTNRNTLDCKMYMRSVDLICGLPFNIASYAALTYIIARTLNYTPGRLIIDMGDAHIYNTHFSAVDEQLKREPHNFPKLEITKSLTTLDDILDLKYEDFVLSGYKSHPAIKADMVV